MDPFAVEQLAHLKKILKEHFQRSIEERGEVESEDINTVLLEIGENVTDLAKEICTVDDCAELVNQLTKKSIHTINGLVTSQKERPSEYLARRLWSESVTTFELLLSRQRLIAALIETCDAKLAQLIVSAKLRVASITRDLA